ncbi:hypothetical protein [Paenibacillus sp. HJGM_3]|uniref:hypothetical protein n=1 Tax=Paenibacillus sp. HJGM_3 TaxID=3379816 RepID=UPI00385E673F
MSTTLAGTEVESIRNLVRDCGTPCYLYDYATLKDDYLNLRRSLPDEVRLYYSLKANPNPEICRLVQDFGSPFEVASVGELELALRIGAAPESILFTGPGKSRLEIRRCIREGIYAINAESVQELHVIAEEAQAMSRTAQVMLRVNLNTSRGGSRMASVGVPSQFGIDEDDLDIAVSTAMSLRGIRLIGLHTHQGTQNFRLDFYEESVTRMFALCRSLREKFDIPLSALGLGGGFGVPFFEDDEPFPIESFGALLAEQVRANADLGLDWISVESGRYIAARMGLYICSVLYTKTSHGKQFAIVDGGTHHRAFVSALGGRSFRQPLPVRIVRPDGSHYTAGSEPDMEPVTIAGKLCTPTDVLQSGVPMREPAPGDIVVFPNAGAYGLTCGNVHFLSHDLPKEWLRRSDGSMTDVSWLHGVRRFLR